ncbi:DsbA family protein [Leptospira jelokensis]|uniref:Oxidoreductase n=1 Tax=Leptospira jelokensis TaxID=2484931 RepID=A0A4Z1A1F2_9LEPT|nr:thioredoxin domain-containing protein [Leptospira jelokensis]TGL72174.1 oxidoreductase [Leptospira jelokensis]
MENYFKSWMAHPISKIFMATNFIFAVLFIVSVPSFVKEHITQDAVSIGGKKYDISDVKESSPIAYSKFQSEYKSLLKNTFGEFAQDKLFELVAKDKNLKPSEVLTQGLVVKEPSEEEIINVYMANKAQLGGKSLSETRDKIVGFLKNQQEQEFSRNRYKEIITKYPVDFLIKEPDIVRVTVAENNNPSIGPKDAKITIIEFSDFECPFCKRSQEVNRQLREKYKGQIRWVFRDFPLPFHQDAMYAHMAANCSIEEGKYWDVFNVLFENTGNLSKGNVDALVLNTGISKSKYQNCMKNQTKLKAEIEVDIQDGQKVGVSGTPAFFINGIFVSGALPFENFDEIIQKELKQ